MDKDTLILEYIKEKLFDVQLLSYRHNKDYRYYFFDGVEKLSNVADEYLHKVKDEMFLLLDLIDYHNLSSYIVAAIKKDSSQLDQKEASFDYVIEFLNKLFSDLNDESSIRYKYIFETIRRKNKKKEYKRVFDLAEHHLIDMMFLDSNFFI